MSDREPNPVQERRLILRVLDYWRSVTPAGVLPAERDIDPAAIPDLWPWCAVLQVDGRDDDPEFSYVGNRLTEWCGADLTGRPLSAAPRDTLVAEAFSMFGRALERGTPVSIGGQFADFRGVTILYRSIVLPLANDGATIVALLGATNGRQVSKE